MVFPAFIVPCPFPLPQEEFAVLPRKIALMRIFLMRAQTVEKVCHCEPVRAVKQVSLGCRLAWGESRALPVANEARRTSGSGQNFGDLNAAAKFWAPQQEIRF